MLAPSQLSVQVKNAVAIENLAEVDVVFSDKTGTMTKNNMKFECCVERNYLESRGDEISVESLFCMALCHTVMPFESGYQGESADEVALVQTAKSCGMELTQRDAEEILFNWRGEAIQFRILAVIPFSSLRKKMSVLL